jgi:predicted DCC family thiol-disulfide oxidoreductase YuxK
MTRYTMLYDGNCRICTGQAQTVAAYNDDGLIEVLDMNSAEARARFPQITPAMAQRELHLVAPDGSLYRGAEAVRATLLCLPSLRGLGELMGLPGAMSFARPVYAWVARNRYLFGGQPENCTDGACERS